MKMKGLGRGLDALLGGSDKQSPIEAAITVPATELRPGKYQPRTRMDHESLMELSESIRAQGIIQPILVRPLTEGYEIIAGERRWRAAQLAGLTDVPVLIRNVPDEAALAMSLIENIQRENLNPLEEAMGIQRLIDEFHMTHERAANAVGRSRSAVSNLLRLLNLTENVQDLLLSNKIDMGHARALLSLEGAEQIRLANEVAAKNLTVRDAERLAKKTHTPKRKPDRIPDRDLLSFQEKLADSLGTRVTIKLGPKGSGQLIIAYDNLDHLENLTNRLAPEKNNSLNFNE